MAAFSSGNFGNSTRVKYKVKDISLAEWGRKEIKVAETEMPGLMAIREEFAKEIGKETRLVSGVSGAGVRELVNEIAAMLRERSEDEAEAIEDEERDDDWKP